MVAHASMSNHPASQRVLPWIPGAVFGRTQLSRVNIRAIPGRSAGDAQGHNLSRPMSEKDPSRWLKLAAITMLVALAGLMYAAPASAQTDEFGDNAADPVRLFERGQAAHARGDFEKALAYYEQAIKVRPEFPEAEFQRGNALTSLGRLDEAEASFRQTIELKKNWSLPYSALGALLMRRNRDADAEKSFRQALTFDGQDNVALRMLAELRICAGAGDA